LNNYGINYLKLNANYCFFKPFFHGNFYTNCHICIINCLPYPGRIPYWPVRSM